MLPSSQPEEIEKQNQYILKILATVLKLSFLDVFTKAKECISKTRFQGGMKGILVLGKGKVPLFVAHASFPKQSTK